MKIVDINGMVRDISKNLDALGDNYDSSKWEKMCETLANKYKNDILTDIKSIVGTINNKTVNHGHVDKIENRDKNNYYYGIWKSGLDTSVEDPIVAYKFDKNLKKTRSNDNEINTLGNIFDIIIDK